MITFNEKFLSSKTKFSSTVQVPFDNLLTISEQIFFAVMCIFKFSVKTRWHVPQPILISLQHSE